jgi:hypothetical protein
LLESGKSKRGSHPVKQGRAARETSPAAVDELKAERE